MRYTQLLAGAAIALSTSVAGAQAGNAAATPATVSAAQFREFQWIVGRWRGLGTGPLASFGVFYEEYAMLNDSTMRMRTATDSTFTSFSDSTRFEFRGSTLRTVPARGTGSVALRIAGDSIQWTRTLYLRINNDTWRAVFPAREPGGTRPYYELKRVRDELPF